MFRLKSVITHLNVVVTFAMLFLVSAFSLFSFNTLTRVISESREEIYLEKTQTIHNALQQKHSRLLLTGMEEAYQHDFQQQILEEFRKVYHNSSLVIYDKSGTELLGDNSTNRVSAFLFETSHENDTTFQLHIDPETSYRTYLLYFEPWQWYITFSESPEATFQNRKAFFAVLIPSILIISVILLFLITHEMQRIMAPAVELANASKAIADGELDTPVDSKGIGEIAKLTENFIRMRDSIREQMTTLRIRELNLKTTLESIGDGVITTDAEGLVKRINNRALKLTAWDRETALGAAIDDVFAVSNAHQPSLYQSVLQEGNTVQYDESTLLMSRDNFTLTITASAAPIRNDHGEIIGMVIVFRDISKELLIREQLHQTQKMDAIGKLAGGVAHDFNNTLAGILGAAEVLRNVDVTKEEKEELAGLIISSSERGGELTKQLLTFSRKGPKKSEQIALNKIIDETVSILRRTIDKRIIITTVNNAETATTSGDPTLIQNAIMNISINASHAMPDGGKLTFSLENTELDEEYCELSTFALVPGIYITLSIRDTGTGMSHDVLQRIFEPFFTTKHQGKGTGLGLAAVYGTIQEHNGAITVYSEVDKGTVFHIYLPVSTSESRPVEETDTDIAMEGKILVVDDEDLIRKTASALLSSMGFTVVCAENGKEGVETFSEHPEFYDVIIMDMMMPVMGGLEAIELIREIDPDIPIIISSGFSKEEDLISLEQHKISSFLHKPFRKQELVKALIKAFNSNM